MSKKEPKHPTVRRNAPCPCGSGRKYGYCCVATAPKRRVVQTGVKCPNCHVPLEADLSDHGRNLLASLLLPVKNFCSDHDLFFFQGCGNIIENTLDFFALNQALVSGSHTKEEIISVYQARVTRDIALSLIDDAVAWSNSYAKRRQILVDAIDAHYEEKYTLSIPILFTQIEGLLRDLGRLELSEKFRPCIPTDTWNRRLLFWVTDDAVRFNTFVSRLFEGQLNHNEFGRNPILHGMNIDYANRDSSLLLLLTVLEIRLFLSRERETPELVWGHASNAPPALSSGSIKSPGSL